MGKIFIYLYDLQATLMNLLVKTNVKNMVKSGEHKVWNHAKFVVCTTS